MVKIDLARVRGNGEKFSEPLLPRYANARLGIRQAWQSSLLSRLPRNVLWCSCLTLALFMQGVVIWRLFFYEPALPPSPPYNATETVGLLTKYYELLRDMHYLGPNSIAYPPHVGESAINLTLAHRLGLDERVIETIEMMPYIDLPTSTKDVNNGWMPMDRDIFWRDGHFVDYRKDEHLLWSQDPMKRWSLMRDTAETFEEAMLAWDVLPKSAIPLSIVGTRNYGLVLVLDTASNRIVGLDTQGGGPGLYVDPFFKQFEYNKVPRKYKVPHSFWGPNDVYARLAPDLLVDFIQSTAGLQSGYIPGSVRTDDHYTPELCPPRWETWVRDLYHRSGWPAQDAIMEYLFPSLNTTAVPTSELFADFESSSFNQEMHELRHNITVRYMRDWYCPVPRDPEVVNELQRQHLLTLEQIAFAQSDEEVIPLNLEGWGGRLPFMQ